jgi:hypothetical protein
MSLAVLCADCIVRNAVPVPPLLSPDIHNMLLERSVALEALSCAVYLENATQLLFSFRRGEFPLLSALTVLKNLTCVAISGPFDNRVVALFDVCGSVLKRVELKNGLLTDQRST